MPKNTQLSTIVLLAIALTCHGYQTYTISDDGILIANTGENCTKVGFVCEDCLTSYNCYQLPNGTWIKELVENCEDTLSTCLASTGLCTSDENKACGFRCAQPGIFPDPIDCKKYHICAHDASGTFVDHEEHCAEGFSYDPTTTVCSNTRAAYCKPIVPKCANGNNAGQVAGTPRMYYRCDPGSVVPRLYYCPPDHKYIRDRCHDVSDAYGLLNGNCIGQGSFYLPSCTSYTICSGVLDSPRLANCSDSKFFNYNWYDCDYYSCASLNL